MSALAASAIRQRVATAVAGVSGHVEARRSYAVFPAGEQDYVHKSFAVGLPAGTWTETDRQRRSEGTRTRQTVEVRLCYRLRGDAQVSDYDAALDLEHAVIKAIAAASAANLHLTWTDRADAPTEAGDFSVHTLTFEAVHRLALE